MNTSLAPHSLNATEQPHGRKLRRYGRMAVATVSAALMVASCSVFTSGENNDGTSNSASLEDRSKAPSVAVDAPTSLSDADPSGFNAAQYFFPAEAGDNDPTSKQLVVAGAEEADQYAAAQAAVESGAPMLIIGAGEAGEKAKAQILELAPEEIVQYGIDLNDDPALAESDAKISKPEESEGWRGALSSLPDLAAQESPNAGKDAPPQVLGASGTNVAQEAPPRAAGAPVQFLAAADPRATSDSMAAVAEGNAVSATSSMET